MATTVTDRLMTSDLTPHTARRVQLAPERWRASWCPQLLLDRNQALTAMVLAETVSPRLAPTSDTRPRLAPADPIWQHIDQWCAELGVPSMAAVLAIAEKPHILDRRLHVLSTTCWCEPATALDGHHDEGDIEFAATDHDPIDADGHLTDVLS